MIKNVYFQLTVAGLVALATGGVTPIMAADTPDPAAAAQQADPLGSARVAIGRQRWNQAIMELRKVEAKDSADWHNLMGFAMRKRAQPDLAAAQTHYDTALKIDPNHKGALEYAGELALMKGESPTAEAYLARLVKLCPSGCEERADLERVLAKYKADGNRWKP
jgi:Flp pilus assembly protein TadD